MFHDDSAALVKLKWSVSALNGMIMTLAICQSFSVNRYDPIVFSIYRSELN